MHVEGVSDQILKAAESGEVGSVIRLARKARHLTQQQLGDLCDCNQSTISRIERGLHDPGISTLRCIAGQLKLPVTLVGLADRPCDGVASTSGHEPVKRREFLQATSLILASGGKPPETGAALPAIHAITAAQRALDSSTPSRDLAESVNAHLRMIRGSHLQSRDPEMRSAIAAVSSETAGFAGWLSWDMNDIGSARGHYTTAIKAARATGNLTLHAYMLGSLATLAIYEGDTVEGLALLHHAAAELGPDGPAIACAWLGALEAMAHADACNERAAWAALDRADAAVDRIPAEGTVPWPWVFQFDHSKVARHRLTCAARLARPDIARCAARDVESFLENGHDKQRALLHVDLATAHLQAGEPEEAFRLAARAIDIGSARRSGRVIAYARRFRRGFTGSPASPLVRAFDERVQAIQL